MPKSTSNVPFGAQNGLNVILSTNHSTSHLTQTLKNEIHIYAIAITPTILTQQPLHLQHLLSKVQLKLQ
jgi:hypothetical protein